MFTLYFISLVFLYQLYSPCRKMMTIGLGEHRERESRTVNSERKKAVIFFAAHQHKINFMLIFHRKLRNDRPFVNG